MKYFNIPGIYDHLELNLFIIQLQRTNPEFFYPDVKISSVFGNFHYCPWDGGRNFLYYSQQTKEDVQRISKIYNDCGIPLRLIFTNPVIQPDDLNNRYCNMILRELNNGMNEVCVNSDLMENYIRKNYPNYKIVSSTTKRITSPSEALKEIEKDYFQICLDYDLNHNLEFLEQIPKESRSKIEFLSNAICRPGCPIRKQHYSYTGASQRTWLKEKYDIFPGCNIEENVTHPSKLGKENNLSLEDIEKYNKMGFKYFKLEGRTLPSAAVFGCYLYYFVKPEAYFEVMTLAADRIGIFVNDPNGHFHGNILSKEGEESQVIKHPF